MHPCPACRGRLRVNGPPRPLSHLSHLSPLSHLTRSRTPTRRWQTTRCRTEKWDKSKHNKDNYEASGFVYDPNQGRGRHKQTGIVVDEERVNDADDDKGQIDDDLRRA
ncbi:MAG: hypothetical protein ABGY24_02610, partial [bacterium]